MPSHCAQADCIKRPSYGTAGGRAELCAEHAKNGMVDVLHKRCGHSGCTKQPSYGTAGGKAELCAEHAKNGMVDVRSKKCGHSGCTKSPSYGTAGGKAKFCARHAKNGMVDVRSTRCGHSGCTKRASYGTAGGKTELCAEHAKNGMVDVCSKRCGHSGCIKNPSYGRAGGKAEVCAEHAMNGMVNVRSKRCGHSGCDKMPSYGSAASRKREVCAKHAKEGMIRLSRGRQSSETRSVGDDSIGVGAGRRASTAQEPRGACPPVQGGPSSRWWSRGGTKRRRVTAESGDMRLPPSSGLLAGRARRGETEVTMGASAPEAPTTSDDKGAVKTELVTSCKAEPAEDADGKRGPTWRQEAGAEGGANHLLTFEQDFAVKPEPVVFFPSGVGGLDGAGAKDLIDLSGEPDRKSKKMRRASQTAAGPGRH